MSWANSRDAGLPYWPGQYNPPWYSVPARGDVNMQGYNISNAGIVDMSEGLVDHDLFVGQSTITSTCTLQAGELLFRDLDTGEYNSLYTQFGILYYDGAAIANSSNTSNVADWALFPAGSNVEMSDFDLSGAGDIYARNIKVRTADMSNCLISTATLHRVVSDFAQFSNVTVSSMTTSNASFSNINTSTITTNSIFTTNVRASTIAGGLSIGSNNTPTIIRGDAMALYSDGILNLSNDRGVDVLNPAEINIVSQNGEYGKVSILADSGEGDFLGGLVEIQANSGTNLIGGLSRVDVNAATVTIAAGALSGLVYVPGAVNLQSGAGAGIFLATSVGPIEQASGTYIDMNAGLGFRVNDSGNGWNFTGGILSNISTLAASTITCSDLSANRYIQAPNVTCSTLSADISNINVDAYLSFSNFQTGLRSPIGIKMSTPLVFADTDFTAGGTIRGYTYITSNSYGWGDGLGLYEASPYNVRLQTGNPATGVTFTTSTINTHAISTNQVVARTLDISSVNVSSITVGSVNSKAGVVNSIGGYTGEVGTTSSQNTITINQTVSNALNFNVAFDLAINSLETSVGIKNTGYFRDGSNSDGAAGQYITALGGGTGTSWRWQTPTQVTTLNGLSNAVTLAAGTNISLVPVGNTITINQINVPISTRASGQPGTQLTTAFTTLGTGAIVTTATYDVDAFAVVCLQTNANTREDVSLRMLLNGVQIGFTVLSSMEGINHYLAMPVQAAQLNAAAGTQTITLQALASSATTITVVNWQLTVIGNLA